MVVVYVGSGDQTQGGAGKGPTEATQVDTPEQEAAASEAAEGRGAKATPEKSRAGNEDGDRGRRSGGEQDGMSRGATPEKPGSAEPCTSLTSR